MSTQTTLSLVLAAALLAAGCQPRADRPEAWRSVSDRWLAEPGDTLFHPDELHQPRELAAWDLADPEEADRWTAERVRSPPRVRGGSLILVPTETNPLLVRAGFAIDASRVELLELETSRLPHTKVFLSWEGSSVPAFDEGLRLEGRKVPSPTGAATLFRFPVGQDPEWRGSITGLRLDFLTRPRVPIELRRLVASALELEPGRLERALSRAWLVDLGGEVREALVQPLGQPARRSFEVPRGGLLRFAGGVPEAAEESWLFQVSVDDGERREVAGALAVEPGAWRDGEADLSPWEGRRVDIVLEAVAPTGLEPRLGLPAWGHPEVLEPGRGPRPPDVVLVSIDTLRADRMSLYGHSRLTTPELEAWAASRAGIFEDAVATSPWTLPSHVSMFTGRNAHLHGVNHPRPAPGSLDTVAEALRSAGWATAAVTGGGYLAPTYGLAQGFQRWIYWTGSGSAEAELDEGVRRALATAAKWTDRPLLLFFHTYEVHAPYRPREPHFSEFAGAAGLESPAAVPVYVRPERGRVPGRQLPAMGFRLREGTRRSDERSVPEGLEALPGLLYDAGVAYTDSRIAGMLRELDARRPDRPLVVVTSDHGEMLGEQGLVGHASLYEGNLRIPLLVALPDSAAAGRRFSTPASLVDIVPTILAGLGLSPPSVDGRSLLPALRGGAEIPAVGTWSYAATGGHGLALRQGRRLKTILRNTAWGPDRGRIETYSPERDPEEIRDLTDELPPETTRRVRDETDRIPGLRLVLFAGAKPLQGALRGDALTWAAVKTTSAPPPTLKWRRPGMAEFHVARRSEAVLALELPVGSELTLEARGVPPVDLPFAEAMAGRTVERRLQDGAWVTAPCERSRAPCVRLGWFGTLPTGPEGDAEPLPPGLLEQLEALGYLG